MGVFSTTLIFPWISAYGNFIDVLLYNIFIDSGFFLQPKERASLRHFRFQALPLRLSLSVADENIGLVSQSLIPGDD